MFRIGARDLEDAIVQHHDAQRTERDAGSDLDLINVVKTKTTCLFDPVFKERVAQGVLGLRFGKIRAFDN